MGDHGVYLPPKSGYFGVEIVLFHYITFPATHTATANFRVTSA